MKSGWSVQTLRLVVLACITRMAVAPHLGAAEAPAAPVVLAHYMPWYEAKPVSPRWGWHWTMNHFDPEQVIDGKPAIASHFHPLIGPYDSSDVHVLEYQLLTMKLAGIDGVIVDWYGLTDYRDYAILHRNTTRLLETAERLQMKFVICYEDQTIPALVQANRVAAGDRVAHAIQEIDWLGKYWFKSPSYQLLDGKPVLLSFGQTGLTDEEWSECLMKSKTPVTYFSQQHRRTAAAGAFDWPTPSDPLASSERFRSASLNWPRAIPVAFPRFVDIYAEAKVSRSYGRIEDDNGQSFRKMLEQALKSRSPIVQVATWNDWGEGTMIEPSHEFGYRELETTLDLVGTHAGNTKTEATPDDLRLPAQLLVLRRSQTTANRQAELDRIAQLLANGKVAEGRAKLSSSAE